MGQKEWKRGEKERGVGDIGDVEGVKMKGVDG